MQTRRSTARRSTLTVATLAAAALALPAASSGAQQAPNAAPSAVEVRPFVGVLIPTGDHADLLKTGVLVGAELGWQFHPSLAVTGSFGWAPNEDRTLTADETVDLFQYDVGIEGRTRDLASSPDWSARPYGRLGVGARTYSYRDLEGTDAETNFVGHGAIGLDVARTSGRVGLRLEARDNLSVFEGLRGELADGKTRNDVQLTAGLTVRF